MHTRHFPCCCWVVYCPCPWLPWKWVSTWGQRFDLSRWSMPMLFPEGNAFFRRWIRDDMRHLGFNKLCTLVTFAYGKHNFGALESFYIKCSPDLSWRRGPLDQKPDQKDAQNDLTQNSGNPWHPLPTSTYSLTEPILPVQKLEKGNLRRRQQKPVIGENFGHNNRLRDILVFASPTGYMFTSSGFPLFNWGLFYKFL